MQRLLTALTDNIQKYEQQFGAVKDDTYHLNFGPKGQA